MRKHDARIEVDQLCDAELEYKHGVLNMCDADVTKVVVEIGEDTYKRDFGYNDPIGTDEISAVVDEIIMEDM